MRITLRSSGFAALVVALGLFSGACDSALPTAPSSNPVPNPVPNPGTVPWGSTSMEARQLIVANNLNHWAANGGANGFGDTPRLVWADANHPAQELQWALSFWESETKGVLAPRLASNRAEANIVLGSVWPPEYPVPATACGSGGPRIWNGNCIILGTADLAFMVKPECGGSRLRKILAHELGHAMIPFAGHTTNGDIMSTPAGEFVSPLLLEVINWLASVQPGTNPV